MSVNTDSIMTMCVRDDGETDRQRQGCYVTLTNMM